MGVGVVGGPRGHDSYVFGTISDSKLSFKVFLCSALIFNFYSILFAILWYRIRHGNSIFSISLRILTSPIKTSFPHQSLSSVPGGPWLGERRDPLRKS